MLIRDVIKIAGQYGWCVTVCKTKYGYSFDFKRRLLDGLPFCFTAEMEGNRADTLAGEILSFVDEFDPEQCAGIWLEASGQLSPTRFFSAVAELDEIRSKAFLLAFDISEAAEKENLLFDPPWYVWN